MRRIIWWTIAGFSSEAAITASVMIVEDLWRDQFICCSALGRLWHLADIDRHKHDVRYWGQSGRDADKAIRSRMTADMLCLRSVKINCQKVDLKGEIGMNWARSFVLALVSFVVIFSAISPSNSETVQFYCRHPISTNDLVVAVDYSTGTVRWNLVSNIRRGIDWLGPAKAKINKLFINWVADEDGETLWYRIDTASGDPEGCAESGCWMSCQPLS